MREKYMTSHKTVRIGRLLEDLDIFAVTLCYKHILNPKQPSGVTSPYSIVTACVDQIDISAVPLRVRILFERLISASFDFFLKHDSDIRLRGHVTWVGKSSIEATMEVDQKGNDKNEWNTV